MESIGSTPSLSSFSPVIPSQRQVLRAVRSQLDYSLGTHEILLSGSLGCLREDAKVLTASGEVPICDITSQHYLLSFCHSQNRFVFQSNSGAFLKDKGTLYRLITKHGEFVASGNHRIATCHGNYLSVHDLLDSSDFRKLNFLYHAPKYPSFAQKSSLEDVLRSFQKLSSFLYHCAKHIHQCDPQLLSDLNNVLNAFPLQDDVQVYDQVSYKNTHACMGVLRETALKHAHIFVECDQTYKQDSLDHLRRVVLALEDFCDGSKSYEHIYSCIQSLQQYHLHTCHPKAVLFVLSKLGIALLGILKPFDIHATNTAIESIEKLPNEDWYWDLQVPNTNNYVSTGLVHHNSSKSTVAGHIAVTHCLQFPKARVLLGRRALPDIKRTIFLKIREHIELDLRIKVDYSINESVGFIRFSNGSEIICGSWADKRYMKFRSIDLSAAIFEEIVENENDDIQAYKEIKARVGRLPHIPENWIISNTNPGSPSSYWYKYFIENQSPTRHVIYSLTEDNPFLPKKYIEQLKADMDEKEARRMLRGEWLDISADVIYYNYKRENNFRDYEYQFSQGHPMDLSFDFNIGDGKPMSACCGQFIDQSFHVERDFVVHGARTNDIMEEMAGTGLFERHVRFRVFGDGSGNNRNTRSIKSDYDIIKDFLSNYTRKDGSKLQFEMLVPAQNPSVRERHNIANAQFLNALGQINFFVYKSAKIVDEGLRLTKLKKGGNYIEDDSQSYQHVTTAVTYWIHYLKVRIRPKKEAYQWF